MGEKFECEVSVHVEYDDFGEYTEITLTFPFGRFTDIVSDGTKILLYAVDLKAQQLIRLSLDGHHHVVSPD